MRLFDVLQELHILESCQDLAIGCTQVSGDGWGHGLSLTCIPLAKLWPDAGAWPEEFTGSVLAADTGEGSNVGTPMSLAEPL